MIAHSGDDNQDAESSKTSSGIRARWIGLHEGPWFRRFLFKSAIVAATVLIVCYPHPKILARHLQHLRHANDLIDPKAPQLEHMRAMLRRLYAKNPDPTRMIPFVQELVYVEVPYKFDWETWGVIDYLPTVAEVMDKGQEDCDGRAVVAASLLRSLGIEAQLVSDGVHVWVRTPYGDTMSPNAVETWRVTEDGSEFNWQGLRVVPRGVAFGLAVFPLSRELVVAFVVLLALIRPGIGYARPVLFAGFWFAGLCLLRIGASDFDRFQWWAIGAAVVLFATGLVVITVRRCGAGAEAGAGAGTRFPLGRG